MKKHRKINRIFQGNPESLIVEGEKVKMRKNPFDCQHEGVWMSRNGSREYNHGAKPLFMWDLPESELEPLVPHHIGRGNEERCTFELVMFYRKKTLPKEKAHFWMEADAKSREIAALYLKSESTS